MEIKEIIQKINDHFEKDEISEIDIKIIPEQNIIHPYSMIPMKKENVLQYIITIK